MQRHSLTLFLPQWEPVRVFGTPPSPRYSTDFALIGDVAYLFGGCTLDVWMNDVSCAAGVCFRLCLDLPLGFPAVCVVAGPRHRRIQLLRKVLTAIQRIHLLCPHPSSHCWLRSGMGLEQATAGRETSFLVTIREPRAGANDSSGRSEGEWGVVLGWASGILRL